MHSSTKEGEDGIAYVLLHLIEVLVLQCYDPGAVDQLSD